MFIACEVKCIILYHIYTWIILNDIFRIHSSWDIFRILMTVHDDVTKWKHFPCYRPFVRGINRSRVKSPHKVQWRGALMLFLICAWMNDWVNNREADDLRRYRTHYDVIEMGVWYVVFCEHFRVCPPNTSISCRFGKTVRSIHTISASHKVWAIDLRLPLWQRQGCLHLLINWCLSLIRAHQATLVIIINCLCLESGEGVKPCLIESKQGCLLMHCDVSSLPHMQMNMSL